MSRASGASASKEHAGRPARNDTVQGPLLVYIQGVLGSLNPTDKLIAEYILKDPERVLYHTISEMRVGCGASVGSIVGFCRRLGLAGFAQLKISLAREMAHGSLFTPSETAEAEESPLEQVFRIHQHNLLQTRQINSDKTLHSVVRLLEGARKIAFFATGLSYPVAYTAYLKFRLIGLDPIAEFDTHMQLVCAARLDKGDVAVGITCSGITRETVRCLEVAKERGAHTICLTNSMKSPITVPADIALYATPSEIKYFQAPLASRVTQLALLDAIFVTLALRHRTATMKQLQIVGEQLLERRAT